MSEQTEVSTFDTDQLEPGESDTVRMKYLAEVNPKKSEVADLPDDTTITFVPLEGFGTNGTIEESEPIPLDKVYQGYTYFRGGDIAIAKITPSFENGKGAICTGLENDIGFGTTELHVLRPRQGTNSKFLWYVLRAKPFMDEAETAMKGVAGQKRVPSDVIEMYRVPDYSQIKQQTIAAFLDRHTARIDALIEKQKRLIDLLKEKRQAVIHDLLNGLNKDEYARLKYAAEFLPGFAFSSDNFTDNPEDVELLRGVNVGVGEIVWDDVEYWPRNKVSDYEQYLLEPKDTVLGMDRPWISNGIRIAQVDESDCPALLVQRVLRIRARSEAHQEYIQLTLESDRFRQYFEPITTGVSVPHISKKQVGEFRIPLPSLQQQSTILSEWQHFEKEREELEDAVKDSIDLLNEKRQALITAAVTGQIDVTEGHGEIQDSPL